MSEANEKGWILHSLAQNKRFGPLSEDELRMYFRAGMVKSVDRLTAPGEFAMQSAAEVATMLGEAVPVGPPPPAVNELPTPLPSMAAGVAADPMAAERAAKAALAANINIAAMMAASAPAKRRSSWVLPVIAVLGLVLMLVVALNMLRRMKPPAPAPISGFEQLPSGAYAANEPAPADAGPLTETTPPDREVPVRTQGPGFESSLLQAEGLKNSRNWTGLRDFAQRWSESQPDRNEPLLYLANANSSLGNQPQAVMALKKILDRDPGNASARGMLADNYLQAGQWAEAAGMYKELTAAMPQDSRMWNNYGAALNGAGQPAQAIAALETAVKLDPSFKQAWTNLGNLYEARGDAVRAAAARANAR